MDLGQSGFEILQEAWETKVGRYELPVTGVLFEEEEEEAQSYKGCWLRGRKYSVSKLAIALSDYVFLLWLAVVIREAVHRYAPSNARPWLKETGAALFVVFSVLYVVLMLVYGRKTPRPVSDRS
jgi:hypothetical protein